MTNKEITIQTRKYDLSLHRTWRAKLIGQNGSLLLLKGVFDKEIEHPNLRVIRRGTISFEYYWLDRWYNVFRFHEPDGEFRNFYCNINMPPRFENGVLDYIDLDIDILIDKRFNYTILDQEEYEENSRRFGYTEEAKQNVKNSLNELIKLIQSREFPFDQV